MEIAKGQKIFVSSTVYEDLFDLRAELLHTIPTWGYVPLAHENPDFPAPSAKHSHDACLEVVGECDVFLLVIGSRYGNIYAGANPTYIGTKWSVTRCEADLAFKLGKECLTFVRDTVWDERKSYNAHLKRGGEAKTFTPVHAKDTEVFEFLNEINRRERANWIRAFNTSVDLKALLLARLTGERADIFSSGHFKKMYGNES